MVPSALKTLGYTPEQIEKMTQYAVGHGTLEGVPHINFDTLKAKGFTDDILESLKKSSKSAFDIKFVFNKWPLGEDFCKFDMLLTLGFTKEHIKEANAYCCGTMTLEEAPYLKLEHLPVFDCASPMVV